MNLLELIKQADYGKYTPKPVEISEEAMTELIYAIGRKFEPDFKIETDFDKWLYQNLIAYFHDDPRCVWDLSKGLFFHGKVGTGKSFSLRVFQTLYYHRLHHGQMVKEKSFKMFPIETLTDNAKEFRELCGGSLFCDEVMRETKDPTKIIVNYGTREQPFSDGVHQMYRNHTGKQKLYHFTTNYWNVEGYPDGRLLLETYGKDIWDRLREMCNFVEFKGESKRK